MGDELMTYATVLPHLTSWSSTTPPPPAPPHLFPPDPPTTKKKNGCNNEEVEGFPKKTRKLKGLKTMKKIGFWDMHDPKRNLQPQKNDFVAPWFWHHGRLSWLTPPLWTFLPVAITKDHTLQTCISSGVLPFKDSIRCDRKKNMWRTLHQICIDQDTNLYLCIYIYTVYIYINTPSPKS